jgi:hypothetical protein
LVNQLGILIYLAKPQKPPSNSSSNELAIPGNLLSPSLALPYLRSWRRLAIREIFRRPRLSRAIPSPPARASIFPRFSLARAMKTPRYISSSRRCFSSSRRQEAARVQVRCTIRSVLHLFSAILLCGLRSAIVGIDLVVSMSSTLMPIYGRSIGCYLIVVML